MYKANVYRVMIASPGDVQDEREIARKVILEWNELHSVHRGIVLLPLLWEYSTTPEHGRRPQGIINDQLLQHADLLVGIFWMRIGSNTGKAISGTVEELETHLENKKPAMLYFSNASLPQNYDREQFNALQAFKGEAQKNGLYATFSCNADFEQNFRTHLARKLNDDKVFPKYVEVIAGSKNSHSPVTSAELPQEASVILITMAQSKEGKMYMHAVGGLSIQVPGNPSPPFKIEQSPRVMAKWKGAVEYLTSKGLIRKIGTSAHSIIYEVTEKGYQLADSYLPL